MGRGDGVGVEAVGRVVGQLITGRFAAGGRDDGGGGMYSRTSCGAPCLEYTRLLAWT